MNLHTTAARKATYLLLASSYTTLTHNFLFHIYILSRPSTMIWSEPYYQKKKDVIDFKRMVAENPVIVFSSRGCCLSLVVVHLLQSVGANPAVHEMEDDKEMGSVARELKKLGSDGGDDDDDDDDDEVMKFPAVFIGGKWFGGLDQIIIAHIAEELTPLLKQGGALWL